MSKKVKSTQDTNVDEFINIFGETILNESNTSNGALYSHLFNSEVLPHQICSPSTSNESMFTNESYDQVLQTYHDNQHDDIKRWYKDNWNDVIDGGNDWLKYTNGIKTEDYRECNPANHKALKSRAGDKIGNLSKGYTAFLNTGIVRFKEECIRHDQDPKQAVEDHPVYGAFLESTGKTVADVKKPVNKALTKLAKNVDAQQSILVKLVGAGDTQDDDNGAVLYEDNIRDMVSIELVEALEGQRDANHAFSTAMMAFDIDEEVKNIIGVYLPKATPTKIWKDEELTATK